MVDRQPAAGFYGPIKENPSEASASKGFLILTGKAAPRAARPQYPWIRA